MQPSFEQHVLRVNSPDVFYHVFYEPDLEVSLSQTYSACYGHVC